MEFSNSVTGSEVAQQAGQERLSFAEVARGRSLGSEGKQQMRSAVDTEEKQNNAQWFGTRGYWPQQDVMGSSQGQQAVFGGEDGPYAGGYEKRHSGTMNNSEEQQQHQHQYQHQQGWMFAQPNASQGFDQQHQQRGFDQHQRQQQVCRPEAQEIATLSAAVQQGLMPAPVPAKDPHQHQLLEAHQSMTHGFGAMSFGMGEYRHQGVMPPADGFAAHPLQNTHPSMWYQQQVQQPRGFNSLDVPRPQQAQERRSSAESVQSDPGFVHNSSAVPPMAHAISGGSDASGYRGQRQRKARQPNEYATKGYRKLWQQVTNVNKGGRLAHPRHSSGGDTTVEELLDIVLSLPPDVQAVPVVAQGLHSLDAGALAALLKELHRSKRWQRSQEIFDWLRRVEDNHPLKHLCTTMTYTTMISQCGSQQALRRAMELMAEMRGRGIPCNVHTYSALMNVCIKAGELELALDVYKQMLSEGCTPNLVTFNTLIDVYGKTGQWEEAIAVLDAVEEQGLEPEARTYNTAIIACNQSSRAAEALQVYERMLNANARPTATTYTALISAYGKAGKLDQALEIFNNMENHGCEKNVITYSSLISACEKAGEWELAISLFNDMHAKGCQPNVVTYNSLIAACAHGGQAEKAQEIFELMRKRGCRPDSVTFGALIGAYDRSGNWRGALSSFEAIRTSGCRADTVVYNNIVGCLWGTGILKAQEKAVQIFHAACKQGHFRMTVSCDRDGSTSSSSVGGAFSPRSSNSTAGNLVSTEFGMHAFTIGSAILCLYRWIVEVGNKLNTDGNGCFGDVLTLTLNKGKPSREHTYPIIKEALLAKVKSWRAPLELTDIPVGCQISGKKDQIIQWMEKPIIRSSLQHFLSFAYQDNQSTENLFQQDAVAESRCMEAFAAVKQFESLQEINMQNAEYPSPQSHAQSFLDMASLSKVYRYPEDVLYDGFDILMRVQECHSIDLLPGEKDILAFACYLIAADQSYGKLDSVEYMQGDGSDPLHAQGVVCLAKKLKAQLKGTTSTISPIRVLKLYLERLGAYFEGHAPSNHPVAGKAFGLLPLYISVPIARSFKSSVLAAAVLTIGRREAGVSPFWPQALEYMTGYKSSPGTELAEAIDALSSTGISSADGF